MTRSLFLLLGAVLLLGGMPAARGQDDRQATARQLHDVYLQWRAAMVAGDLARWQALTGSQRQISIRNRILSEKRPFAQTLFRLPAPPPDVTKLRMLDVKVKGPTAKLFYFGAVDFGVGGGAKPDNLLVLSFVAEAGRWKYDTADFVNLAALPDVRKELAAGKLAPLAKPEFAPSGVIERQPMQLRGPVKWIAKTYVFCPGREVRMHVNKVSRHLYQNTKASEVIIGGAKDGRNEVQYTIKDLPGGQGNEPLTVRVYLMSQVEGTLPIKIFEYLVPQGGKPKPVATEFFQLTPEVAKKLLGQK